MEKKVIVIKSEETLQFRQFRLIVDKWERPIIVEMLFSLAETFLNFLTT